MEKTTSNILTLKNVLGVIIVTVVALLVTNQFIELPWTGQGTDDPITSTPQPTTNTSENVSDWTLTEVYWDDENITEQKSSVIQEINACIAEQKVERTCTEDTSGRIDFSTEIKASAGGPEANIGISPTVSSGFSYTRGSSETRIFTTPLGYVDTIRITEYSVITPGRGSLRNSLGEILEGDIFYFTGTCSVTIDIISRESCGGQAAPTMPVSPTTTPNIMASPQVTTDPVMTTTEIIDSRQLNLQVDEGEIHVLFLGPGTVEGIDLTEGKTHGNIIILLPRNESYVLSNLNPGNTWHGIFSASSEQWRVLAERYNQEVRQPGKCSDGLACTTVTFIILTDEGQISYP